MARRPRHDHPGALHHLTIHAAADLRPFESARGCELYLRTLGDAATRGLIVHAYCLMPNHVHLLASTLDGAVSRRLQWLNGVYARRFLSLNGGIGHVFGGRFHSGQIERQEHLLETIRYMALNPVRAGMCRHPAQWRWSSHRAYAGTAPTPPYLTTVMLELFGDDLKRGRREYARFVMDGLDVVSR